MQKIDCSKNPIVFGKGKPIPNIFKEKMGLKSVPKPEPVSDSKLEDKVKPEPKKVKEDKQDTETKRLYGLNKSEQIKELKKLGLSSSDIKNLRYEHKRVEKIKELRRKVK